MFHLKIKNISSYYYLKHFYQKDTRIIISIKSQYKQLQLTKYFSTKINVIGSDFIIKSQFSNINENVMTGLTIPEFIWKDLHLKENLPALECAESGKKLTHGDVYKQSRNFASALIKSGLQQKDVINIILPNIPEYAIVLFGIWEAGGIASPTNPVYTEDEIIRQIKTSEAKMVITTPISLQAIYSAKKLCPNLKTIIVIDDSSPQPQHYPDCYNFKDMLTENNSINDIKFLKGTEINTKEQVAILPFSSGTTGPPKGVQLTHSNICSNLAQMTYPDVVLSKRTDGKQEKLFGILPFFHVYGLSALLLSNQYLGGNLLCIPKFHPETFIKYFKYFQPTTLTLVTPLISFLVSSPGITSKDFISVECIQAGAAPVGTALINKLLKKVDKYIFFQEAYGLTELSPCALAMNKSKGNSKLGSCGTLVPGTLGKIIDVDNHGKCLGPNEKGEVCIAGPQVMKGYFKNEQATKDVIDSEGWFHTGDIGYYDEDGCFYIVDRMKELIKVKGLQVAPAELEDELRKIPDIIDVAVIGIPDERAGELPRAYIVRKSNDLTESKINNFLNGKISKHKELKGGIEFVKIIPKAASGKILRRELKSDYLSKYGSSRNKS